MTSHELARILLAGPDVPVLVDDDPEYSDGYAPACVRRTIAVPPEDEGDRWDGGSRWDFEAVAYVEKPGAVPVVVVAAADEDEGEDDDDED